MRKEIWGVGFETTVMPRARLLCLCHAGGSASGLFSCRRWLPDGVELWIAEYPGRGFCARAEPIDDLRGLARHFAERIPLNERPLPTVVFGHSMGALVAYELVRCLPAVSRALLRALCVSCCKPPSLLQQPRLRPPSSDDDLVRSLTALGGTPPELVRNPTFRRGLLGAVRRDHAALDAYVDAGGAPLEVPLAAIAANDDPIASPAEVALWRREARYDFTMTVFDGGHFYYVHQPASWARTIAKLLALPSDE